MYKRRWRAGSWGKFCNFNSENSIKLAIYSSRGVINSWGFYLDVSVNCRLDHIFSAVLYFIMSIYLHVSINVFNQHLNPFFFIQANRLHTNPIAHIKTSHCVNKMKIDRINWFLDIVYTTGSLTSLKKKKPPVLSEHHYTFWNN